MARMPLLLLVLLASGCNQQADPGCHKARRARLDGGFSTDCTAHRLSPALGKSGGGGAVEWGLDCRKLSCRPLWLRHCDRAR